VIDLPMTTEHDPLEDGDPNDPAYADQDLTDRQLREATGLKQLPFTAEQVEEALQQALDDPMQIENSTADWVKQCLRWHLATLRTDRDTDALV